MWNLIKGVFGESKHIEKGMDMVDRGVDAMFFTEEEKSQASMKRLEWKLKWVQALGPQSKARRYIAYLVASLWTYLVVLGVHLHLFGYVEESKSVFEMLTGVVNVPFGGIMAFYFLTNVVRAR